MSDFVTSQIRTYAPIAVGGFISWLTTLGLEIDPQTQAGMIIAFTGVVQALYYLVVRLLERVYPKAGVLLGSSKTPEYREVR